MDYGCVYFVGLSWKDNLKVNREALKMYKRANEAHQRFMDWIENYPHQKEGQLVELARISS